VITTIEQGRCGRPYHGSEGRLRKGRLCLKSKIKFKGASKRNTNSNFKCKFKRDGDEYVRFPSGVRGCEGKTGKGED